MFVYSCEVYEFMNLYIKYVRKCNIFKNNILNKFEVYKIYIQKKII